MAAQDYIGNEVPLVSALTTLIDRAVDEVEGISIEFGYDEDGDVMWTVEGPTTKLPTFGSTLQSALEEAVSLINGIDAMEEE